MTKYYYLIPIVCGLCFCNAYRLLPISSQSKLVKIDRKSGNYSVDTAYTTMRKYSDHYYRRVSEFEMQPPISSQDIVMIGNSITEGGSDWSERLAASNIINRGINGDTAEGIYDRLYQILPGKPQMIFLMCGINDVSHNLSADSIALLIEKLIVCIKTQSPTTKIYLQSLLPINESIGRYKLLREKTPVVLKINLLLGQLAAKHHIQYLNIFSKFTDEGGKNMSRLLSTDGLHLNETGYNIWADELKKCLR